MIHTMNFEAMGTSVTLAIAAPQDASERVEEAFLWARSSIHRDELRWSRFLPDSEVSRISLSAGEWTPVHRDTMALCQLAAEAYHWTNGLFHPGMATRMSDIGYHHSFHDGLDSDEPIVFDDDTPIAMMLFAIDVDELEMKVRISPQTSLDLGGIAKGFVAERVVHALMQYGFSNAACNAGGDIYCRGTNEGGPWTVGIDHPFDPTSPVGVELSDGGLATSGTYKRKWRRGNDTMHHLLNPRTGKPSSSDIVSCTVGMSRLTDAEVCAKVCLLLGKTAGMEWLEQHGCTKYVLIDRRGEVTREWKL